MPVVASAIGLRSPRGNVSLGEAGPWRHAVSSDRWWRASQKDRTLSRKTPDEIVPHPSARQQELRNRTLPVSGSLLRREGE